MNKKYTVSTNIKILIGFFIFVGTIITTWFASGNLLGNGESGLIFYNVRRYLNITSFAWSSDYLGYMLGIGNASMPSYWVFSTIQNIGIPGYILQAFFFLIVFLLSGLSIYLLTRELLKEFKPIYGFVSVLIYWLNPFTMINIWNRFLYNYILFWAVLPLFLYLYIKGIRQKDFKYTLFTSLTTVVFSYSLNFIVFDILLWSLLFTIILFYCWINSKSYLFYIKYVLLTLVSFLLFNFWWLHQSYIQYINPFALVSVKNYYSTEGNINTLEILSHLSGKFTYLFRFIDFRFLTISPNWTTYLDSKLLRPMLFFPLLIIFYSIYKNRKKKEILFLSLFFIFSIFLLKGTEEPFGDLYLVIFSKITFLQIFRNPFEKFSFFAVVFASLILAYAIYKIFISLKGNLRKIFITVVGINIIVWTYPYASKKVFSTNNGFIGKIGNYEVKVPVYYLEANDWLNSQNSIFRFISIPINDEGVTYNWANPFSGSDITNILFDTPNISFNTTIAYFNDFVKSLTYNQMDEVILDFAPFSNSRYLMVRKDVDFKARKMADPKTVEFRFDNFLKEGKLTKKTVFGDLIFYELPAELQWKKLYTTDYIIRSNSKDLSQVVTDSQITLGEKIIVISPEVNLSLDEKSTIYYPLEILKIEKDDSLSRLSEKELIDKLVYVKHSPGEFVYPFIKLKEKLITPPRSNFLSYIIYKTDILGKRVVEMSLAKNTKSLLGLEEEYVNDLSNMQEDITNILKDMGDVSDYVRGSLLVQKELLKKYSNKGYIKINEILQTADVISGLPLFEINSNNYLVYKFKTYTTSNFTVNGISNNQIFYLNGNQQSDININSLPGDYEIALPLEDIALYKEKININEFNANDQSVYDWNVDIPDKPTTYEISFEYKFEKGTQFYLKYQQNIDDPSQPLFTKPIKRVAGYDDWKKYKYSFTTTSGSEDAELSIEPISLKKCTESRIIFKTCKEEKVSFNAVIKNFILREVNYPNITIIKNNNNEIRNKDYVTEIDKVNPSLYKVKIDKDSSTKSYLIFSELYNSGWKAFYSDGMELQNHILANVYANAWVIDKEGDYEVTVKFMPQDQLEHDKKISVLSISLVILGLIILKKKRKNVKS